MQIRPREGIKPISDFRRDSARILKELRSSRAPILLTQRGRSVAVLLDLETYEDMEYAAYVRAKIARGEEDARAGRVVSHSAVFESLKKRHAR